MGPRVIIRIMLIIIIIVTIIIIIIIMILIIIVAIIIVTIIIIIMRGKAFSPQPVDEDAGPARHRRARGQLGVLRILQQVEYPIQQAYMHV